MHLNSNVLINFDAFLNFTVHALMQRMGKTLFFRTGSEPFILTEEQREMRRIGGSFGQPNYY